MSEPWEHEHKWILVSATYECECGMMVTVKEPKFLPHAGAAKVDFKNILGATWERQGKKPIEYVQTIEAGLVTKW